MFFSKTTSAPRQGYTRLRSGILDSIGEPPKSVVVYGYAIGGRLDVAKLEAAFRTLQQRWPQIMSTIGTDSTAWPPYYFDFPSDAAQVKELQLSEQQKRPEKRSFCHREIDGPISDTLHIPLSSDLPQDKPSVVTPNVEHQYWGANAGRCLADYLASDTFVVTMHITRFSDATLFALSIPHLFCDGAAARDIMLAFSKILDGKAEEVKPVVQKEQWSALLTPAGQPEPPSLTHWRVPSALAFATFLFHLFVDMWRRPIATKEVYLPPAFIRQLVEEARAELRKETEADGVERRISTGDVLSAWALKMQYATNAESNAPVTLLSAANMRYPKDLPGFEPLPEVYLGNAFICPATPEIPASELAKRSLGSLALFLRQALLQQTKPEIMEADWRYRLYHRDVAMLQFFSPNAFWHVGTNWLRMDFGNFSLANALEPGQTGPNAGKNLKFLGQILHPMGSRNGFIITSKEAHGGVWLQVYDGVKNWTDTRGWGQWHSEQKSSS